MSQLRELKALLPDPIRAVIETPVRQFRKLFGHNLPHVRRARKLACAPRTVLVVGANLGGDCRRIADLGAEHD